MTTKCGRVLKLIQYNKLLQSDSFKFKFCKTAIA